MLKERPVKEEVRKDRPAGEAGKEVHAVRLGVGDRSYLVRDKQIEVLKNVYGGVQVSTALPGQFSVVFPVAHFPSLPVTCSASYYNYKSQVQSYLKATGSVGTECGGLQMYVDESMLICVAACRALVSHLM